MSNNLPKKNGNLLQCHLAFLQKAKERRRWSVASIPSSGYGTNTPASSSNSQCSLNTEDHYSCTCLHSTHHSNHSQTNTTISASPKLYHSGIAGTLAQHYSSNDSNPSLIDDDGRLLSTTQLQYFRPRSRSLSSPVRSPALDSKSTLDSSTSKENLIQTPIVPGTLTFRRRSRSLSSPIRSPNVENRFVQMNYVYKERFPNAINQMNEKLEKFIKDNNEELIPEIAGDAVTRFVHHQAIEMAKDCLQKSKDELLTSHYFHEMSDSLEKLICECKEKSTTATQHLKKLIKQLLLIVSRPARLLECLEFNPEEFYRFLEAAEGQATISGIKTDLPQYIINKLGLNKEIQSEFKELNDQLEDKIDSDNKLKSDDQNQTADQLQETARIPSEKDYETIKLISNGAYGAVYLVKHKETGQRYAMKKINKQNLALRNQIEQAFAERDIMCFTDNPFVVSLFCSFETKLYLCMVMEYVEGGDCATLLKNMGPLPVDLAKFYFAEAVLAVEYLHSYGIIHRDLKPANLLITALGHIKLTDFGLSKIGLMNLATNLYEGFIDRETKQFNDNQVYGTAEYIAPEVILRQGYGKPVDWWSMGIILYEFLIGMVPFFSDGTAEDLFSHVINDEIEWPSEEDWALPEEAKLIITQLLMPNPIDRLGTVCAGEVKEHPFFHDINWDALLRQKAEFVPQLTDEYDTSYFDTRLDRYNHELMDDSEGLNDSDDSPLFSSFSSCSPRYHRMYSKLDEKRKSSSTLSIMDDSNSRKSSAEEKEINKSLIRSSLSVEESSLTATTSNNQTSSSNVSNKKELKCKKDLNEELLNKLTSGIKEDNKYLNSSPFTPESSQTESEDYSPLMHRRRKTMESTNKEMPKFNIEMPVKEELTENQQQRPLTPSIKETPPDDSNNEVESNSNDSIYDENRLSLQSTKLSRPVIKSASASGLSQLLPEPIKTSQQRRYTQPDGRQLDDSNSGMFSDNSTTSSIPDQTELIRNCLNKNLLSKIDSPKQQLSTRNSLNVRKNSLRQMSSPYASSASSSRDNSPNHDLITKRKGSIEPLPYNSDKRKSAADISLSSSFTNLSKLKPPVILRKGKSTRGYGFSFKAIRVYYGDSDVYTVHHLVMNVEPNSPAFEAGLKAGDLITHINSEPLQGLLHHQVLQLVLSAGEKIEIRTTPLESTSIKSGGRKRNPLVIKLAKRGINRHHAHRKSSALFACNEQIPSAISSLSPVVLKRTDSDKRRKNTNLFRRLSSKRASADVHQFLTTSSCLQTDNQLKCIPNAITPSKSFQYLTSNSNNNIANKEENTPINTSKLLLDSSNDSTTSSIIPTINKSSINNNNLNSHIKTATFSPHQILHHQYSISDSSQSSSPNSSVPQSPATLTTTNVVSTPLANKTQQQQQSISAAAFNRPNTLHGLKYKLVQTFRSPRRKSCGSITIPLSPLARSDRNSSTCTNCCQAGNLMAVSPTRSPSPLAFSNNNSQQQAQTTPINHRHSHHFHRHRHSQINCHPLQSNCLNSNCLSNNCKLAHHHQQPQQSNSNSLTDANLNTSLLNSSTNCKKSICSSHCSSSRVPVNDLDLYNTTSCDKIAHRSKSAEPETMPVRRVSCACDQYDQIIYDNQCFNNRHCNCIKGSNLKIKKCNCFIQSPLALSPTNNTRTTETNSSNQIDQSENTQKEINKNDNKSKNVTLNQQDSLTDKDSETNSSSSVSNCSVMTVMNDKLNETIETIPECLSESDIASVSQSIKSESPSKKSITQQSTESTFSKVKKSIGSPINIRKTLFKQSSDKKNKNSNSKSKDNKESKEQKD